MASSSHIPGQPTRERRPDERRGPAEVGDEPDPRFSFANERTFLAWNRTALALIAAGAAAAAFLRSDFTGAKLIVALPLIALGAVLALSSYRRWERNERAMRLGDPLEYGSLPRVVAVGVGVMALVIAVVVVADLVAK
jgi:putative membrane protein